MSVALLLIHLGYHKPLSLALYPWLYHCTQDWKAADMKEEEERRRRESVIVHCLRQYLEVDGCA